MGNKAIAERVKACNAERRALTDTVMAELTDLLEEPHPSKEEFDKLVDFLRIINIENE